MRSTYPGVLEIPYRSSANWNVDSTLYFMSMLHDNLSFIHDYPSSIICIDLFHYALPK